MILILLFSIYIIIFDSNLIRSSFLFSVDNVFTNVVPLLFFYFIIIDLLIESKAFLLLSHLIKKIVKTNYSKIGLSIYLVSFLLGNPGSTKTILYHYEQGLISATEKERLLKTVNMVSPIFLFTQSKLINIDFFVILIIFISNALLVFIFRGKKNEDEKNIIYKKNYLKRLFSSIRENTFLIILIIGIITLLGIISEIVTKYAPLEIEYKCIIIGLIEISNGISFVNKHSIANKELLFVLFSCFSGLSIIAQSFLQIEDKKAYNSIILSRVFVTIIGLFLYTIYFTIT